ncbi:MAG: DMT family transporter [Gemmatimonadetes bacterium]|nr:DMT family transporter [Gemmatimonadota bacterium]
MTETRDAHYRRRQRQAMASLLLMVLIWGINFPIAKHALGEITPPAFNCLRFPLASLVVLLALARSGPIPWPAAADRRRVLVLGLIGNALYQQFFIFGLANSHAGIASVLLAATPIFTTLASSAAGHERISNLTWAGVALGFGGLVLVITHGGTAAGPAAGESRLLGNLMMLCASLAWAFYTVGSRDLVARYGPVPVTAWTLWTGAIAIVLIGLPSLLHTPLHTLSPATWFAVGYAGVLSIGLAYLIWYHGVEALGNTRTSAFSNLTPVIALLAAWLTLGEAPGAWQLAGSAVVLIGVSIAQFRR